LAAGLEVNSETVAAELIRERGPLGETYLTAEHTLRRLRSGEYLKPRLSVSGPFATWQEQGAKDTYQLARERVREAARLSPAFGGWMQRLDEILLVRL
jgi:trimethylamine--corrinoid protein Co-methyltransferase